LCDKCLEITVNLYKTTEYLYYFHYTMFFLPSSLLYYCNTYLTTNMDALLRARGEMIMFSQLKNKMWRDANPRGTHRWRRLNACAHQHIILTTNAIIAHRRVWCPLIKCSGLSHTIGGSGRLALKMKQYSPTRIWASSWLLYTRTRAS